MADTSVHASVLADRMSEIQPFHVMKLLARAKELESQGRSIIHMEVGEPDFPTPQPIVEAGIQALKSGKTHYTPATGLPSLKERIARYYQDEFGVDIQPHRVIVTPGSSGALQLLMSVLINPGESVLLSDPGYPCNRHFVRLTEGIPVSVPVNEGSAYQINSSLAESFWQESSKAILLASPSNPTGSVIEQGELEKLLAFVREKQAYLLVDEIYQGLTYHEGRFSALQLDHERTFVVNSFSKYFGMTGWRLGWTVVPEAFVDACDRLAQNVFLAAPTVSQHAALAAFSEQTREILQSQVAELKKRRDFLIGALQDIGFKIHGIPQGAFYLYMDSSAVSHDSFRLSHELLEKVGVAITPGLDFGQNQPENYVRFAFANPVERLAEGVDRIRQFILNQ